MQLILKIELSHHKKKWNKMCNASNSFNSQFSEFVKKNPVGAWVSLILRGVKFSKERSKIDKNHDFFQKILLIFEVMSFSGNLGGVSKLICKINGIPCYARKIALFAHL